MGVAAGGAYPLGQCFEAEVEGGVGAVLDIDDVDTGHRLLRVLGKGNKQRSVPFGEPAADALQGWLTGGRPKLVTAHSGPALLLCPDAQMGWILAGPEQPGRPR